MKKILYKFCPIILGIVGLVLVFIGFLVDKYIPAELDVFIWIILAMIFFIGGIIFGTVIKKLNKSIYSDPLTGLRNRRYFYIKLDEEIQKSKKNNYSISLLMIDLDNFKLINDSYGHPVGDEVLKSVSQIMIREIKSQNLTEDLIARLGGEEFSIIFPNINLQEGYEIAESIRKSIAQYSFKCGSDLCRVTMSGGIVNSKENIEAHDLILKSDKALYDAKKVKDLVSFRDGSQI